MENYKLYVHIVPNGKKYFGITSQKVEQRWGKNGDGYRTQYFYRAIQKYGWENIKHYVLFENLTKEEAEQKEVYLIKKNNTVDSRFGYNVDFGGALHGKHSPATREKLRLSHLGKKLSEETKRKMSISRTGQKRTVETREKLRLLRIGEKNPNYNKKMSEEQKKIRSEISKEKSIKRKVFCFQTGIIYPSIAEASRLLGVHHQNIIKVCKGERKTTKGYSFNYI